jgi:hypothetical protein
LLVLVIALAVLINNRSSRFSDFTTQHGLGTSPIADAAQIFTRAIITDSDNIRSNYSQFSAGRTTDHLREQPAE